MDLQFPIVNPWVPFLGYIPGGLSEGRMVIVQGRLQPQAKRFAVTLRCGGGDVALQLTPRFPRGRPGGQGRPLLVAAACRGGRWEPEERHGTPAPLSPGGALEVIIRVRQHGYQVAVTGQHVSEFLHRVPPDSIQALEVTGDVTLSCVTVTQAAGGALPPPETPLSTPVTVSNPSVPFHMVLRKTPAGLIPPITIVGTVHPKASRFHANLWSSASGAVVLHVNPRPAEGALVLNSRRDGCWGPEQRPPGGVAPFRRGQPFQLEIRPLSQAFALWVNGSHLCNYDHRLPPATIDQLEVAGDITLACVKC